MKRLIRSARPHRADNDNRALGWFGPLDANRPLPVAAVVVPAVLLACTGLAAAAGFDFLLDGALSRLAVDLAVLAARWAFLFVGAFAIAWALLALTLRGRRAS